MRFVDDIEHRIGSWSSGWSIEYRTENNQHSAHWCVTAGDTPQSGGRISHYNLLSNPLRPLPGRNKIPWGPDLDDRCKIFHSVALEWALSLSYNSVDAKTRWLWHRRIGNQVLSDTRSTNHITECSTEIHCTRHNASRRKIMHTSRKSLDWDP